MTRTAAHPRSRGENINPREFERVREGSSPLTRGKPSVREIRQAGFRLIPAHAGKTASTASSWTRPPAHPRSRGENDVASQRSSFLRGSSPLTRGKPVSRRTTRIRLRLIPAHAGKTKLPRVIPPQMQAHPRSRGENAPHAVPVEFGHGSSPLTRGKPAEALAAGGRQRLIPAHAGKTPAGSRRARQAQAHPRSRGENVACRD